MPNTLGHLGVQGFVTRAVFREADPRWICLGCVLPDVPWILQRALSSLVPGALILDFKLYGLVQGTLLGCLVLSAAVSLASAEPARVFRILALGAVIHLLLDATQARWANGVHLFAPLSWRPLGLGLYWPESPTAALLTLSGLVFALCAWQGMPGRRIPLSLHDPRRLVPGAILLVLYLIAPLAMLGGPERADNMSVAVLRDHEGRAGREVQFDRTLYIRRGETDVLSTFTGEELGVRGRRHDRSGRVSLRGRFLDPETVEISELHAHWPWFRDLASYVGLALVALIWVVRRGPGRAGAGGFRATGGSS